MRVGWRILRNAWPDLPDPFAGNLKLAANFLESTTVAIHEAKALFEHLTFAFGERVQHVLDLILE